MSRDLLAPNHIPAVLRSQNHTLYVVILSYTPVKARMCPTKYTHLLYSQISRLEARDLLS